MKAMSCGYRCGLNAWCLSCVANLCSPLGLRYLLLWPTEKYRQTWSHWRELFTCPASFVSCHSWPPLKYLFVDSPARLAAAALLLAKILHGHGKEQPVQWSCSKVHQSALSFQGASAGRVNQSIALGSVGEGDRCTMWEWSGVEFSV